MFRLLHVYILFNLYIILIKCNPTDDLNVRKTDQRLIAKKRQDTREMCKIFNSETRKASPLTKELPLNKYVKRKNLKLKEKKKGIQNKKTHRIKRSINSINPAMNVQDEERVETIVDKIYDDLLDKGQMIAYRRKDFPKATTIQKAEGDTSPALKDGRRFPFAPKFLDDDITTAKNNLLDELPPSKPVRFPHGIVPYFIDPATYDSHLAEILTKAFDYFEKATCIRLQRLRERPRDRLSLQNVIWLYITNPSGIRQCVHSNERAEIHGVQMITFGYDCMSVGDISHEIMHVLGFAHEHLRPDRDQHITILWENIKPGYKQYFEVHNETIVENLPYDYASIMHYPPRAFSRNGKVTILTEHDIKIGQREALSEMDIERIDTLYSNECIKRNREYMLKTCPSVVKPEQEPAPISKQDVDDYFRDRLWPYGVVTYTYSGPGEFTSEEEENIQAVMNHIKNETCVQFVQVSNVDDKDSNKNCSNECNDDQSDKDSRTDEDNRADENSRTDEDNRADEDSQSDEDSWADIRSSSSYNFDSDELKHLVILNTSEDIKGMPEYSTSSELEPSPAFNIETRVVARKGVKAKDKTSVKRNDVKKNYTKNNVKVKNANFGAKGINTNIGTKRNNYINVGNKVKTSNVIRKPILLSKRRAASPTPARRHRENVMVLARSSEPGCTCPNPGRHPGYYVVYVSADCFNSVNDLLHLFVHVLGLEHQHNMHDRDSYIHIVWDQLTEDIEKKMRTKLPPAASLGYPYDYQSVMHYPWLQIKDGKTNIMYPIWNDGWAMGHWQGLSTIDIQKIKSLYAKSCQDRVQRLIKENKNRDDDESKDTDYKLEETNSEEDVTYDEQEETNSKDYGTYDEQEETNSEDFGTYDEQEETNSEDFGTYDEQEETNSEDDGKYDEKEETNSEDDGKYDEQEETNSKDDGKYDEQEETNSKDDGKYDEQEETNSEDDGKYDEQEETKSEENVKQENTCLLNSKLKNA